MGTDSRKPVTPEEFVIKFIERFRDPGKSKGVHTVFSGFNAAFREYFPGLDPVEVTNQLADEGKIVIRPVKRGVMIYKAGEAPATVDAKRLLKEMGLEDYSAR